VLLLAGGGVAAYLLTRPTNHVVPTVDGESVTTAEAAVADAGFAFTVVRQPDHQPAGTVFAQFPLGGTKAKAGSKVTLTVSDGPGNVTVPAVIGEPEAQAEEAIRTARLGVGAISQQNSSSVPSGNVISSAPVAGQSVPAGEKVNLIVSSGAPMKKVPNVVGQSQSAAKSALQSAGFQVTVSTEQTSSAPANNVISQNPSGGTQEPSGFTVSIVVAKALPKKTTVTVPDVKGDTPTQATSTLQAAGFAVTQASRNVTNSSQNGLVVSERPAANSTTKKGATVTITVGKYTATTTSTNTTTTSTSTTSTTGT
jgi:beta-lactam-binding protein with PASTA domain